MTIKSLMVDSNNDLPMLTDDPPVYIRMGYYEVKNPDLYWYNRIEAAKARAAEEVVREMRKVYGDDS